MSTYASSNEATDLLGRRVLASFIDLAVAAGVLFAVAILASFTAPVVFAVFFIQPIAGAVLVAAGTVLCGLAPYVVLASCVAAWDGQTPGHRAMGVRIVRDDGAPFTFSRAVKRELLVKGLLLPLRWLVTLGVLLVVDAVRAVQRPDERLWHDVVCRTDAEPASD